MREGRGLLVPSQPSRRQSPFLCFLSFTVSSAARLSMFNPTRSVCARPRSPLLPVSSTAFDCQTRNGPCWRDRMLTTGKGIQAANCQDQMPWLRDESARNEADA